MTHPSRAPLRLLSNISYSTSHRAPRRNTHCTNPTLAADAANCSLRPSHNSFYLTDMSIRPHPASRDGQPRSSTRRDFLKTSLAFGAFSILPASRLYGKAAPSEQVNLAAIGIGNRGEQNLQNIAQSPHCRIVALCDIDLQGEHTAKSRAAFPGVPVYSDFRKLFDEMAEDIDAVLISTPDHSHFAITMLAMSLGKHVYVEKPLGHTFAQNERLMDLARRSGVVTQMGNQGHSGANYFQFKAWKDAGIIKDVTRVTAFMNNERRWHGWGASVTDYPSQPIPDGLDWDLWSNAYPIPPFSDRLHPAEWRSWFQYGSGAFGDWGPHILDTVHEFLELGLPERVTALRREGANPLVYPQASTIEFAFPARGDMPACDITWYDGTENKPTIEPELGPLETDPDTGKTARVPFEIKKPGKVIYSKEHVFHGNSHEDYLRILPNEKYMDMRRSLPRFPQKNSNHYVNFLLACKGEETTRSPFHISAPLTQVFNLGIIAQRLGGELAFDRNTKRFHGNDTANALLDPEPRPEWKQYYTL